jgi:hypothetical protein
LATWVRDSSYEDLGLCLGGPTPAASKEWGDIPLESVPKRGQPDGPLGCLWISFKIIKWDWLQWLTPVIPGTQKMKVRRIEVRGQPRQKSYWDPPHNKQAMCGIKRL